MSDGCKSCTSDNKEPIPALFRHSSRAHLSKEVSSEIWMFGFDL